MLFEVIERHKVKSGLDVMVLKSGKVQGEFPVPRKQLEVMQVGARVEVKPVLKVHRRRLQVELKLTVVR